MWMARPLKMHDVVRLTCGGQTEPQVHLEMQHEDFCAQTDLRYKATKLSQVNWGATGPMQTAIFNMLSYRKPVENTPKHDIIMYIVHKQKLSTVL